MVKFIDMISPLKLRLLYSRRLLIMPPTSHNLVSVAQLTNINRKDDQVIPLSDLRFLNEIPKDRIKKKFVLAGGPGGMNVNKVATKAEIRFNVKEADWIPKQLREYLVEKYDNYINVEGEFILSSMVARKQHQNLEDCYAKLRTLLRKASEELIEKLRPPSDEDIQILEQRKEEAEKFRRINKARLSAKRRDRRVFDY